jgi:flagellar hook-associated protein 3 FlgL
MQASYVSTGYLTETARSRIQSISVQLDDATKEVSSGRLADVGAVLGFQTGEDVASRALSRRLAGITDANAATASSLDAAQAALGEVVSGAQGFLGTLLSTRADDSSAAPALAANAAAAMAAFTDAMNTADAGAYIFSGLNSSARPLAQHVQTPASPAGLAIAASFQAAFGIAPGSAGAGGITASGMQSYLDKPFANEFSSDAWHANWSAASDKAIESRISTTEIVTASVSANDAPFRALASALSMIADLGIDSLNPEARQAVITTSAKITGQAIGEITNMRAGLGVVQSRITAANERMSFQKNVLDQRIDKLEGVDSYEAASRVNALQTQLQASMALLAKIQQISLINYL